MKTFKSNLPLSCLVATLALFSASSHGNSEERLNGREAADACKQEITALYANNNEIKFKRNPASSLKSGSYRFWINSTEKSDGSKSSVRYLCDITRAGELLALTREPGRWKI